MHTIVDVGSNTVRMNVYDVKDGKLKLLFSKKETVGLASYVRGQYMSAAGIEKVISVLEEFKDVLNNLNIHEMRVFATAALRNVKNSQEAVEEINRRTGLQVQVISGREEAELDFLGAAIESNIKKGLLVDIGGGSTELVAYKDGKIKSAVSIAKGSLNSYNKYVKGILPTKEERKSIKKDFVEKLEGLQAFEGKICVIIINTISLLGNHFAKTSGRNYLYFVKSAFFNNFTDNIFCLSDIAVYQSGLHAADGFLGKNGFRLANLDFRKLRRLLPEGIGRNPKSRGNHTSNELSIRCDDIIGCGSSKIHNNNRTAIKLITGNRIHNTVCASLFRVCRLNFNSGTDTCTHNNRLQSEIFDDCAGQRVHDRRHNGCYDHIIHIFPAIAFIFDHIQHEHPIFVGCTVDLRSHSKCVT